MNTPAVPPAPPPGPGVRPPFVAAPVEGRRARTWLGLGLVGGVLVALCGVGTVSVGGLLLLGEQVVNEQARDAAGDYLAALAEEDLERAYELRCRADRRAESLSEFTRRVSQRARIESYQVGDVRIEPGESPFAVGDMTVPVDVVYADGSRDTLTVPVAQNQRTGRIEVCRTDQGS